MSAWRIAVAASALLVSAHVAQADVIGTVTLFEKGTSTPLTSIDFGKVKVGDFNGIAFDISWDFGYPWAIEWGSGIGFGDPDPPFYGEASCFNPKGGFFCDGGSATFTPTAPGKIDGFLTVDIGGYLSNCAGDPKGPIDEEGTGPIYCLFSGELALEEYGTASLTIPITGIGVTAVPIPAALPLLASGLGVLGVAGWRRRSVLRS